MMMPWDVNLTFWQKLTRDETVQNFSPSMCVFGDWQTTSDITSSSDEDAADNKTQEELLRTTQLVFQLQSGKMVPKLREPRNLYGFNPLEFGPQQSARWPVEIEVLHERIKHIFTHPTNPEPFYKPTGLEKAPMCQSALGRGRAVYEYVPIVNFAQFIRSRVGGSRGGCAQSNLEPEGPDDKTLMFESRFESGNLAKAVQVGEFEYELLLRNDLYTNKHTQWYYFRVMNMRAKQTYRFTIVNNMKPDSLYNQGMKPLMYSQRQAVEKKIGWYRGGTDIKYYRNNAKYSSGKLEKTYYSLTWTCQFPHDRDTCYFAHCYPYTYSDLQDYILNSANDPVKSKICKQRVLCRSLAGNMVYVLSITSPSKNPDDTKHRKAVVVTSRVHPGESNASWMMKGFLDYLMANTPDAKLLRDNFIFKIVPMLNPDGVIVGNYRCSLTGRDLNRNYKTVLKESFPPIWHTRNMIRKLIEEREVIAYCDLHGHSRKQNVFIYGCENRGNPTYRLRERIFPVMLSRNAPEKFSYDSCKFKIQKSKEGTGRIVMWQMGIMNSYTMEATFAGSILGKMKGFHFSSKDFEDMGYHFCDTLLDYCDPDSTKVTNILTKLEEKLKIEIMQHLKQSEGQDLHQDISGINLDEIYTSDVESSDGGSDSSLSDAMPIHLQYVANKLPRKKRLRTKKERDKHTRSEKPQSVAATETVTVSDDAGAPVVSQAVKKVADTKVQPVKYSAMSAKPKLREEKATSIRYTTEQQPHIDPKAGDKKNSEGYIEALKNAYMTTGILVSKQQAKELPYVRTPVEMKALPCHPEGSPQQQEKVAAAQYANNQVQQVSYPEETLDERCTNLPLSASRMFRGLKCTHQSMVTPTGFNKGADSIEAHGVTSNQLLSLSRSYIKQNLQSKAQLEPATSHQAHTPCSPTNTLTSTNTNIAIAITSTINSTKTTISKMTANPKMNANISAPKSRDDLQEGTSDYSINTKGDRKTNTRKHLVEISTAQQRQMQFLDQQRLAGRETHLRPPPKSVKQHPLAFESSMEHDVNPDSSRRGTP